MVVSNHLSKLYHETNVSLAGVFLFILNYI